MRQQIQWDSYLGHSERFQNFCRCSENSKFGCLLSRHVLSSCECHDELLCFLRAYSVEISNQGRLKKKKKFAVVYTIFYSMRDLYQNLSVRTAFPSGKPANLERQLQRKKGQCRLLQVIFVYLIKGLALTTQWPCGFGQITFCEPPFLPLEHHDKAACLKRLI